MTEPSEERFDFDELSESIRQRVRATRRDRGLSAAQLAQRLAAIGMGDFNGSVIANYESGRRRSLTVEECFAIAHVLDTTPAELTGAAWSTAGDVLEAITVDQSLDEQGRNAMFAVYFAVADFERRPARTEGWKPTWRKPSTKKTTKRPRKAK
jgi:transcriptional regulator with XRE-family HTH domain